MAEEFTEEFLVDAVAKAKSAEAEYDYARAQCPTCGTPGFAQDRSGDEQLEIPPEVIERGLAVLRKHFDAAEDDQESRDIVVDIFRAMQKAWS